MARAKTKTKIKTKRGKTAIRTKTKTKTRVRRSPEEARAVILDAARRVFSEHGPDAAGLKDVAREAGVSHGLITHYFGTFDALVEETMAEHAKATREALLAQLASEEHVTAQRFVESFFDVIEDPFYGRLAGWAILSGRFQSEDFFPRRERGPTRVVDGIETWLRSRDVKLPREEIELALILVVTAGIGYGMGKTMLWASLGHEATAARDRRFRVLVTEVVDEMLERRSR